MELRYFHNKKTELISLVKSISLALICLSTLYFLNNFTTWLFNFIIVPVLLSIPIVASPIYILRTILVINKPFLILNEEEIKYFNVLGYEEYSWTEVDHINFDEKSKMIFLSDNKGKIFNKISIEGLQVESQNEILKYFTNRINLVPN